MWMVVAVIAIAVLSLAAVASTRYLGAASSSPDAFVVYFGQPLTAAQPKPLVRRLSATWGVVSVTPLDTDAALATFKAQLRAHPDDFIPQLEGPPPLSAAIDIRMRRPWNAWPTRQVIRSIEGDPAFHSAYGVPAPPSGWDTSSH